MTELHLNGNPPFLILKNVSVSIHEQTFFDNLDWFIEKNQHWAVLGPNGSGKSILAKAICRNIPFQKGRIHYFFEQSSTGSPFYHRGEIIMISPEHQKDLLLRYGGYHQSRWQSFEGDDVPTVDYFLSGTAIEHSSPYEVTPLRIPETEYQNRREKALDLLGINNLLSRKIHQLSNGESRKVLIARALMQRPKLIILDDPYGGLDSSSRITLKQEIENLLLTGEIQIILITSRSEEISESISHVLYIGEDQKIVQGQKDSILKTIGNQFNAISKINQPELTLKNLPDYRPKFKVSTPTLIGMKNVSVSYQGTKILSNINWQVNQGERWVIMGPNGAGKSTLLSLILADNPQSYSNDITLFGHQRGSGESIWDIKQYIGWVSPELLMYFQTGQTCLEVVCSGFYDSIGLYHGCTPSELEKAQDWIQALGLESLSNLPFLEVSMGIQRIILLIRALVKNPLLLILDEPCQGLDDYHKNQIIKLLEHFCQQTKISMIYVTHHQSEIPDSINYILKLRNGEIVEIGPFSSVDS